MTDLIFYAVLALFIAHELDAVKRQEWKVLPIFRDFPPQIGFYLFIVGHIPLLIVFFWLMGHPSPLIRTWFQIGLDSFAIVHTILHWLFQKHEHYDFNTSFSKWLIYLTSIMAIIHLLALNGFGQLA